jgi:hypothetical protein
VWITYRLARDLVSAGERQEADALMRAMVNRQPQDAERVYASGLYLSGNDQDDLALAQIAACRAARGRITFVNWKRVCKATGCCARPTSCATAATKRRRSPSSNSSRLGAL